MPDTYRELDLEQKVAELEEERDSLAFEITVLRGQMRHWRAMYWQCRGGE